MPDAARPARRLVIPHQTRKYRQAGRVGTGPARLRRGPHVVAVQVENGTARGAPAAVRLGVAVAGLVKAVVVAVDHDHMTVARAGRAAFDGSIGRDGVRPRVAFGRVVGKHHRHARLAALHHHIRDADGRALPQARAKVREQAPVQADTGDQVVRVGIDRAAADVGVPRVVGRKGHRAVQRRAHAQRRTPQIAVTGGARRRCWRRSRCGRRGSRRPGCRARRGVGVSAAATGSQRCAQADDGHAALYAGKPRCGSAERRGQTWEGERHAAPFVKEARSICLRATRRAPGALRNCTQTFQRHRQMQSETTNFIAPRAGLLSFLGRMNLKCLTVRGW